MEKDILSYLNRSGSGDAAGKAETIRKLAEMLSSDIVRFRYRKLDGSVRDAYGTRDPELIAVNSEMPSGGGGSSRAGTFAYFDMEKHGWRCFRYENIMGIDEDYAL